MIFSGMRLKTMRETQNIKRTELLKELCRIRYRNYSNQTLINWEESKTEPKINDVIGLSQVLNCTIMDLIEYVSDDGNGMHVRF